MQKLNIIIVGHNEEKNLPKLLKSLKNLKKEISSSIIYCDQKSSDNSIKVAQTYGIKIEKHKLYGCCETSRIKIVNEFVNKDERILFLDCDKEISEEIGKEISEIISKDYYNIIICPININFMGMTIKSYQPRCFKKGSINLIDTSHHRYQIKSNKIIKIKNYIKNYDLKVKGNEISEKLEKLNRYTEIEINKNQEITYINLYYGMFLKPIIYFFGFGILRGYFFKGISGRIFAYYNACYEFFKYAKYYEKKIRF